MDRGAVTPVRRALVSVWEKTGLVALGGALASRGIELVASGGTARALADAGLAVTPVESVTGFPELLEGRVKTLHPAVHAAILARRSRPADMAELARRGIAPIDMVVVDLYPFAHAEELGAADEDARADLIDIGGVALIRAAAKNWRDVAVVTDRGDYDAVIAELAERGGGLSGETRRRLAAKAMRLTSGYDAGIAAWLGEGEVGWPQRWAMGAELVTPLRYGENPHQPAALYRDRIPRPDDLVAAEILQGKELSYNNYLDLEAARRLAHDLRVLAPELAHCAIVKHTIPCGAASAATVAEAYAGAHAADPVSAFGGVVGGDVPRGRVGARVRRRRAGGAGSENEPAADDGAGPHAGSRGRAPAGRWRHPPPAPQPRLAAGRPPRSRGARSRRHHRPPHAGAVGRPALRVGRLPCGRVQRDRPGARPGHGRDRRRADEPRGGGRAGGPPRPRAEPRPRGRGPGLGRLLPVRRRGGASRRGGRHGNHPAGRVAARR
jgi:hypothetical protein